MAWVSLEGKSSIIKRFLDLGFDADYNPTIEEIYETTYTRGAETYNLVIYDILSTNDSNKLIDKLIRRSDIVMIVFSLTKPSSFEKVMMFQNKIFDLKPLGQKSATAITVLGIFIRK